MEEFGDKIVRSLSMSTIMLRILLSVPHMGGREQIYVREAFATNWLSTVGPNLTAFEQEFSTRVGLPAVALSSGTAALHLALRLVGVGPGCGVFFSPPPVGGAPHRFLLRGGVPFFCGWRPPTRNRGPRFPPPPLG